MFQVHDNIHHPITRLIVSRVGFGNLRTGNMRTNSANYGREPRVQCEPESANFLCN